MRESAPNDEGLLIENAAAKKKEKEVLEDAKTFSKIPTSKNKKSQISGRVGRQKEALKNSKNLKTDENIFTAFQETQIIEE